MTVWKIRLETVGANVLLDGAFQHCSDKGIVGVSWEIDNPDEDTINEAVTAYIKEYFSEEICASSEADAKKLVDRILDENYNMAVHCRDNPPRPGEFVWVQDPDRKSDIYLGKIKSRWTVVDSGEHYEKTRIVSFCECPFYEVEADDVGIYADEFFARMEDDIFRVATSLQPVKTILAKDDAEELTEEIWESVRERLRI